MTRKVCRWGLSAYAQIRALRGGVPATIAFLLLIVSTLGLAQADLEEVHVTPGVAIPIQPGKETYASLKAHTKPFTAKVDLVLVPVTITDPKGSQVLGLTKESFQVYENKELQTILYFSSEDAPISLGVIFDTSGSMGSGHKIDLARKAIVEFLKTSNPQDEAFVVTFADKPHLSTDFTSSVEDIQSKLVYALPNGHTALLDAIYLGVNKLRSARYQRRALLIISDGGDNNSRYNLRQITSLVEEADVQIYAIGVYNHCFPTDCDPYAPLEERLGPQMLSDITQLTGGCAFVVDRPSDLADIASKLGVQLRNQYVVGYRPKALGRDGKWHKIKVKLTVPKGLPRLHLYAKKGYYAPSE